MTKENSEEKEQKGKKATNQGRSSKGGKSAPETETAAPMEVLDANPPGEIPGKINMAVDVVSTIAALAAREVKGIRSLGRSNLLSVPRGVTHGVAVELGDKEAALDLEVVLEYGVDIRELAGELRKQVAQSVDRMAGRKVVELNLHVVGIELPGEEKEAEPPKAEEPPPRVR